MTRADSVQQFAARKRMHPAVKALVVIVVLGGVGWLFVRSVTDVRSEPYEIPQAHLTGWTLASAPADDIEGAAVVLRAPVELTMDLFRQLFRRQMESLSASPAPGIVLALRSELAPAASHEQVLTLARESGLERAAVACSPCGREDDILSVCGRSRRRRRLVADCEHGI